MKTNQLIHACPTRFELSPLSEDAQTVWSLMKISATCLALIFSLLSEAQDEALYILVIFLPLLITLHNTPSHHPSHQPSNLLSKMSNAMIFSATSPKAKTRFISICWWQWWDTRWPSPILPIRHRKMDKWASFKLGIYSQRQQMAEKTETILFRFH